MKKGVLPRPLTIQLEIPDDIVVKREQKARNEPGSSVEQRLKDYHREMDMVRLYFPNAEIVSIDGTKSKKQVESEIGAFLRKRYKL